MTFFALNDKEEIEENETPYEPALNVVTDH
jgi:hypothetical protein